MEASWADREFILADTGGLELSPYGDLWENVRAQIEMAVEEADVVVMLVDAASGLMAGDTDVANMVRRSEKPVVLAANKADNEQRQAGAHEFYDLGLGEPTPISAYHNVGLEDLMERVLDRFPPPGSETIAEAELRLAIVGRTNTGKSTLVNAITGRERAIVSDRPGTTRDALDTLVTYEGRTVLLIDTAGIRRRGKVQSGVERYSVLRAVRAIDRSDVAILLMDAGELATSHDAHIASYILDAYKGVVLAVNKWDLADELGLTESAALTRIRERFKFAPYAPVCLISAERGEGIDALMDEAHSVYAEWTKGVPRYQLRRIVLEAVARHPPAPTGRRSLKIYGVAQEQVGPPTFTFYVNRSDMVHFSYQRYLENALRQAYRFEGSRLRMRFKGRGER